MDLMPTADLSSSASEDSTSTFNTTISSSNALITTTTSATDSSQGYFSGDQDRSCYFELLKPVEVWTWGENSSGQLGLADFAFRRQPCRLEKLNGLFVKKVSVGGTHCTALTSTGEVGSQSSVLDMAAGNDFTVILVNGLDNRPAVYYCGRNHMSVDGDVTKDTDNHSGICDGAASAQRLSKVEKLGPSVFLDTLDDRVITGCLSVPGKMDWENQLVSYEFPDSLDVKEEVFSSIFGFIFGELKFSRNLKEICCILTQLYQESFSNKRLAEWGQSENYLESLCTSLNKFFVLVGSIVITVQRLIGSLPHCSDNPFLIIAQAVSSVEFLDSIKKVHAVYCDLIQLGFFSKLEISESVDAVLVRLCMEYAVDSHKPHRRLKHLLRLPANQLQSYIDFAMGAIELTSSHKEQEVLKSRICLWRNLRTALQDSLQSAEETNHFWKSHGKDAVVNSLKFPGRYLLRCYDRCGKTSGTIKQLAALNGKSLGWQKFLLFSDCIALVEKRSTTVFYYPLVWVVAVHDVNRLVVELLSPELEVQIEFDNTGAKTEFVHLLNQALVQFIKKIKGQELRSALISSPPLRRAGFHKFGPKHSRYPDVVYDGDWILGKPDGNGRLSWSDGRIYSGKFRQGVQHGFGNLLCPGATNSSNNANDSFTLTRGFWDQGDLCGLAIIQYGSGVQYEGYMVKNLREGHGVMSYPAVETYIGTFSNDKRHGYGVRTFQREKYLGMWCDDKQHGLGILVTIDGTVFSGTFHRGVFVKGKMVCFDGIQFEGDFNGLGLLNGKGTLSFLNKDSITGWFQGNFLENTVKISSASYSRQALSTPTTPVTSALYGIGEDRNAVMDIIGVPADQKWVEIFDAFIQNDLGLSAVSMGHKLAFDVSNTEKAWEAMVVSIGRLKQFDQKTNETLSDTRNRIWAGFETIPNWRSVWNVNYLNMVQSYCEKALEIRSHPLSRLIVGLADIFSSAYSGVAAHALLLDTAVAELRSLIRRFYELIRLLFPSLPDEEGMHDVVLLDLSETSGKSQSTRHINTETPSSFLEDHMVRFTYSTLFTLYALRNDQMDGRYWQRVTLLNTKSDVTLLDFFGVLKQLWPIELKDTKTLDAPMVCATAKNKYYAAAIDTLQQLGSEFCPSEKLKILVRAFEEVSKSVNNFSPSPGHVWSMDDLCPVFLYVVVRAQLQRLGAEIQLMEDFLLQIKEMGPVFVMFTTLKLYEDSSNCDKLTKLSFIRQIPATLVISVTLSILPALFSFGHKSYSPVVEGPGKRNITEFLSTKNV